MLGLYNIAYVKSLRLTESNFFLISVACKFQIAMNTAQHMQERKMSPAGGFPFRMLVCMDG